ncbi:MAG: hypothetical protein SOV49_05465 [Erysipelotrichaceae bacterium]|nr:hypothetical protein [Erysipelotrichaceae bacterium]
MNNRSLDKTKKTNIKCENCKYFVETNQRTPYAHLPIMACDNRDSKWYGECRMYWNRCKSFEWSKRYDHPTEKGGEEE